MLAETMTLTLMMKQVKMCGYGSLTGPETVVIWMLLLD